MAVDWFAERGELRGQCLGLAHAIPGVTYTVIDSGTHMMPLEARNCANGGPKSLLTSTTSRLYVTSRPKTVDTLVQKLQRTTMTLDQVEDVAGVRIDAGITLAQQTNLAPRDRSTQGRMRSMIFVRLPHSGYTAVHIWPRAPAGRIEVQFAWGTESDAASGMTNLANLPKFGSSS
jgi:hypothetical protein